MGRRLLPGMSHKLNVLCDHYGICLDHHKADSDSRACAAILLRYLVDGADIRQFIRTCSFLLDLPFKHKGIMCAPFIGSVSIGKYLPSGQIEQVLCDGENYGGARPCYYEWVKSLRDECVEYNVTFVFCGTGRRFVKDGKLYKLEGGVQTEQAYKSGLSYQGKSIDFKLTDAWGYPIAADDLYVPYFGERCQSCGMRMICNGCSRCGKCL